MATLIVTYSRIDGSHHYVAPVAMGANVRTETLTMPATGALAAIDEEIVELLSDADCWVAIGQPAPDSGIATDGTGAARKLKADIPYQFHVRTGDTVAVEAA